MTIDYIKPLRLPIPDGLNLAFATRRGGFSPAPYDSLNMSVSTGDDKQNVARNRKAWLGSLGFDENQVAIPLQVHGSEIGRANTSGEYDRCDALITQQRGVVLSVRTADCVPVLIWSSTSKSIAAVHSGWRGTELNILGKTLTALVTMDNLAADLNVAIGPGMRVENFEVGPEFHDKFAAEYLETRNGRLFFDNFKLLIDQALNAGVPAEQIEDLGFCSFADSELFFSHRRDGPRTGLMLSVIGWTHDNS